MQQAKEKVQLTTTEARQGTTGQNVNRVLIVSLSLAIIAGIILVGAFWFLPL